MEFYQIIFFVIVTFRRKCYAMDMVSLTSYRD